MMVLRLRECNNMMLLVSLILMWQFEPSSSFVPSHRPQPTLFAINNNNKLNKNKILQSPRYFSSSSRLFFKLDPTTESLLNEQTNGGGRRRRHRVTKWIRRIWNRFDTLKSAGIIIGRGYSSSAVVATDASSVLPPEDGLVPPVDGVPDHLIPEGVELIPVNPSKKLVTNKGPNKTLFYFLVFLTLIFIRWYRSKYIVKTDFWDVQPGLNIVTTNQKQEDELRAYTCKNCGSTLFIARNREWYFEGETGLAGLGCYACGTKGADNFIMDRDRIKEEVKDVDDYYDYDRPLDFVQKAEYKALMKEAKGNEDKANEILTKRQEAQEENMKKPEMFAKKWVKDAEVVDNDDDGGADDGGDDVGDDDDDEYYDEDEEEWDDEEYEDDDEEWEEGEDEEWEEEEGEEAGADDDTTEDDAEETEDDDDDDAGDDAPEDSPSGGDEDDLLGI